MRFWHTGQSRTDTLTRQGTTFRIPKKTRLASSSGSPRDDDATNTASMSCSPSFAPSDTTKVLGQSPSKMFTSMCSTGFTTNMGLITSAPKRNVGLPFTWATTKWSNLASSFRKSALWPSPAASFGGWTSRPASVRGLVTNRVGRGIWGVALLKLCSRSASTRQLTSTGSRSTKSN